MQAPGIHQQPLHPVPGLFFPDLSLAIILNNTILGLHQSTVRSSSPFFDDTLSLPQPKSSANSDADDDQSCEDTLPCSDAQVAPYTDALRQLGVDTGRVVCIVLDHEWWKEDDVVAYFWAVYRRDLLASPMQSFEFSGRRGTSARCLAGTLRLAAFLQDARVQLWAARMLGRVLSIDTGDARRRAQLFDDFDNRELPMSKAMKTKKAANAETDAKKTKGYFAVIATALREDLPWLLPVVYWRLTALSREEIEAREDFGDLEDMQRERFLECHARAQQERATLLDARRVAEMGVRGRRARDEMQMAMFRRMMDIFGCLHEGRLKNLRTKYYKALEVALDDGSDIYMDSDS